MQVEPPLAGEITQALYAIPWVRCASGNVLYVGPNFVQSLRFLHLTKECKKAPIFTTLKPGPEHQKQCWAKWL